MSTSEDDRATRHTMSRTLLAAALVCGAIAHTTANAADAAIAHTIADAADAANAANATDAASAAGAAGTTAEIVRVAQEDSAEDLTVSGAPGALAPAFALAGPDGATVRLEELRGSVVYVDFWASWCAPCLQSFPWMNTVAERFRADGLRIVAINLDSDRDAAERFLTDIRADFDIAFDPDGTSAEAYGVSGMPSSYVVDRDGRVVHAHIGFRRKDAPSLEAAIASALADETAAPVTLAESEDP